MKTVRRIFQWPVCILFCMYLAISIAMLTPPVQRIIAEKASQAMHDRWGWDISIGKARIEPGLRLILDEVILNDKQGERMLHISRIAAKPDLIAIMKGQIGIANAQLFGTQAHLYQKTPDSKPNFQFLIDTFKSKDTKEKNPMNLRIGSIVLRRVAVNWDREWIPRRPYDKFDANHLSLSDITMTASLDRLTQDTCGLRVKRFSFKEACGLQVERLDFNMEAGLHHGRLHSFRLGLPHSTVEIPNLEATYDGFPRKDAFKQWISAVEWNGITDLNVSKRDFTSLVTLPELVPDCLRLYIEADGSKGQIRLRRIDFSTADKTATILATATINNITDKPLADLRLLNLQLGRRWTGMLPVNLGSAQMDGHMQISQKRSSADISIRTENGRAKLEGRLLDMNHLSATFTTDGIDVDQILNQSGRFPVGYIAATVKADGDLKGTGGKPDLDIDVNAPILTLLGYEYHGVKANAHISSSEISLQTDMADTNGSLGADILWHRGKTQSLDGHLRVDQLAAANLGLWSKYRGTRTTADIDMQLRGSSLSDLTGDIGITGLKIESYNRDTTYTGPIDLNFATHIEDGIRTTTINSQPIILSATGRYNFATLPSTAMQLAHLSMPSMVREQPRGKTDDQIDFNLEIQDSTLLTTLLNTRIYIPEKTTLHGWIDGRTEKAQLTADIPYFDISGQSFKDTHLELLTDNHLAKADIQITRLAKKSPLPLQIQLSTIDDHVRSQISWNPQKVTGTFGTLDITTTFPKYPDGTREIRAWLAPTYITIADTLWQVNPASLAWHEGALSVNGLNITQGTHRSLRVYGRMSKNPDDTLTAQLHNINLEYVMDMVNFHSVDFGGDASGYAKASGLLDNPRADAYLRLDHFLFNHSDQGHLDAHANWGEKPHHILIDAHISDAGHGENGDINGWVRLGDKPHPNAIDLSINTRNFNMAFLNRFTDGIVNDVEGRTTGYVRVFGPLKAIDLEGDLHVDSARMFIPTLGVEYALRNDSVHLSPGLFAFDLNAHDTYNNTAHITGRLRHTNFKNMSYDFQADANNILGYNFPNIEDNSFAARIFATGRVSLKGEQGKLSVDLDVTPDKGSTFTYNVETPGALTEAGFIHYISHDADSIQSKMEENVSSDLYINFKLQMTPDVRVRLLMNKTSDEAIELSGNGRLIANYYNKGAFRMYGTYRLEDGRYNINIQNFIRKDFTFQNGGTIVFGGDPMQASLNMKAVYTIPNVSLDDLTSQSLGFAKTKVNCIMNLTGKPSQPQLTFDFDMPDATQDERQMVRAMVSTDEERNLQAIYLLGLGRFYSYSNDATGSQQSSQAVNSLVSSTLSSQLNQFISNAVGNSKWSFGTNLKTGEDGWKNMDVEGQINGSLFNDRLLVSGNFGYREKYYTQRNFISDVDVQYLLTKNGSVALKAYNQANDRYFVQSSLNTQGIGIVLKKDFNYVKDIFRKKNKKK